MELTFGSLWVPNGRTIAVTPAGMVSPPEWILSIWVCVEESTENRKSNAFKFKHHLFEGWSRYDLTTSSGSVFLKVFDRIYGFQGEATLTVQNRVFMFNYQGHEANRMAGQMNAYLPPYFSITMTVRIIRLLFPFYCFPITRLNLSGVRILLSFVSDYPLVALSIRCLNLLSLQWLIDQ